MTLTLTNPIDPRSVYHGHYFQPSGTSGGLWNVIHSKFVSDGDYILISGVSYVSGALRVYTAASLDNAGNVWIYYVGTSIGYTVCSSGGTTDLGQVSITW
jgi:hypothetical protein